LNTRQIVILAGGLGTRLRSIAPDTPKSLVPVADRPFIDHQLELVRRNGFTDVVLCTGYLGDRIEAHVADGSAFGVSVHYSREPADRLMGTGGALVNALSMLERTFLVIYGDSYLTADYQALTDWAAARPFPAVMSVYRNEDRLEPSNVRVDGERVSLYAKGQAAAGCDHIDYGLSLFSRAVVGEYASAALPLDLGRIQANLAARDELGAFVVPSRFYEVGSPHGWRELDARLRQPAPP
jgi:N-acetyl-alpha-D-muramate 1-phosphate uridylyltransferase